MKGYFSKIARQSGVRLGNESATNAEQASDLAPLPPRIDREEVVVVAPDPTPPAVTASPDVETRAIPESQKVPAIETRASVEEAHPRPPSERPVEESGTKSVSNLHKSTDQAPAVKTPQARTNELPAPAPLGVSDSTVVVPRTGEPPAPPEKIDVRVDHFTETAKIISGRQVSKEEASSILVREIHEWIAATPDEPDEDAKEVTPRDRAVAAQKTVGVIEQEPGVVRITGEVVTRNEVEPKTEAFSKPIESASLSEQTLDLSIGSINVVIEGDAAPAPQVPEPATRPPDPGNETSRGSSRLRRSYI